MPAVTFHNAIWAIVLVALGASFFVGGRFERSSAYSWTARTVFFLGVMVIGAVRGAWLVVAIAALGVILTSWWSRVWWRRYRDGWS